MSGDRWVFVQDDGTIILREENDGWLYLLRPRSSGPLRWTSSGAAIRSIFSGRPRTG
jgi:hypothetical protein